MSTLFISKHVYHKLQQTNTNIILSTNNNNSKLPTTAVPCNIIDLLTPSCLWDKQKIQAALHI